MNQKISLPAIMAILPFAMILGFITVLVREIGGAFKAAWLEAMIELESAQRHWRR